jgi:hypothetical protein
MSDPAFDRRVDELMALGKRCAAVGALFKILPDHAGHIDHQALGRIARTLRKRFWTLAHQISETIQ